MSNKREFTRAELVRLRREQEHAKYMERASKVTARPVTPVTPRAKKKTVKSARKSGKNTRRRFNIALPMPRTNVRSASVPRPRLGWRLLSFVLASLLGTAIYFAFEAPELRVTEAQAAERWPLERSRPVGILTALVDVGYLRKTPTGVYQRRPDVEN